MKRALSLLLVLWCSAGLANAPESSIRPVARSAELAAEIALQNTQTLRETRIATLTTTMSASAVPLSPRPVMRPIEIMTRAREARAARRRGSVCGVADIQGEVIAPISGRGACGVAEAVRITSVSGLRLSTPATIDCTTAQALNTWVQRGVLPTVGNEGGGPVSLRVMSHYACRNRNSQAGARLSEHAKGRAIDIGGIGLRNGSEISVLNGWGTGSDGGQLRDMHRAACDIFGTVLGPNANSFHRDHFHFDTARYRSGSYCR